jgi:Iron-binding zinc finger CDGSH type
MSPAKTQVSVTVSKDGPYIVSGDAPLTKQMIVANADGESLQWQEGEAYDAPARYALCRCGTPIKRRSAMAATQKSALTAPKPRSAHVIQRRQPYSTARSLPF